MMATPTAAKPELNIPPLPRERDLCNVPNRAKWPWIYGPRSDDPSDIKKIADEVLKSEDILTEIEFNDEWKGTIVSAVCDELGEVKRAKGDEENNFVIDFKRKRLLLPKFVAELYMHGKTELPSQSLRYGALLPHSPEGETHIVLSTWAAKTRQISNYYLCLKDARECVMFINSMHRFVFEVSGKSFSRCHLLTVMLHGHVQVAKITAAQRDKLDKDAEEKAKAEEEERNKRGPILKPEDIKETEDDDEDKIVPLPFPNKTMYFVMDEELVGLFDSEFSECPTYDLRFYRDKTDRSIETIYFWEETKHLEISIGDVVYLIAANHEKGEGNVESFEDLTMRLRDRDFRPKPSEIFSDGQKFEDFMTGKAEGSVPQAGTLPKMVPFTQFPAGAAAAGLSAAGLSSTSQAPVRPATSQQSASLLIEYLRSGDHLQSSAEDLQLKWFAVEGPLEQLIKDGKVPHSTTESAGLDPKSEQHLRKAIDDVKEHLDKDEYDTALSRLYGYRRVFDTTLLAGVQHVTDLELLKRIFFMPKLDS